MVGLLVGQKPAQRADHCRGVGGVVSGSEIADEIAEPARWVGQLGGQVVAPDERPVRMALPARGAQSETVMAAQLATAEAVPRRRLRRPRPRTGTAPAGLGPDEARLPAARA